MRDSPRSGDLAITDRDGVRTLVLGPAERRNALSLATRAALCRALVEADQEPEVRVVVVTGAGDSFCAGADIAEVPRGHSATDAYRYMVHTGQSVTRVLLDMKTLTLARVDGAAAGGGMFLALGCDLVIATERARFIPSQLQLALPPDWGGLWLLPRLVGRARAKALLLRASPIAAAEAAEIGLIAECVAVDRLDATVASYCERITGLSELAVALIKDGIDRAADVSLPEFEAWESAALALAITSGEYDARVAEFLGTRESAARPSATRR